MHSAVFSAQNVRRCRVGSQARFRPQAVFVPITGGTGVVSTVLQHPLQSTESKSKPREWDPTQHFQCIRFRRTSVLDYLCLTTGSGAMLGQGLSWAVDCSRSTVQWHLTWLQDPATGTVCRALAITGWAEKDARYHCSLTAGVDRQQRWIRCEMSICSTKKEKERHMLEGSLRCSVQHSASIGDVH